MKIYCKHQKARPEASLFGLGAIAFAIVAALGTPHAAQAQYVQKAKLVGRGDGAAQQGTSVALSSDGTTLIVGGPGAAFVVPPGWPAGAAWVFKRDGNSWSQQAILRGSPNISSNQGYSVALSEDGDTAIVGAPGDYFTRGEARVFERVEGRWTRQATLFTRDGRLSFQGQSVALSRDGNTAIVGGYNDGAGVGAAWVFTRSGGAWTRQAKLLASDAEGGAYQGWSVAMSGDGVTALVGGPYDNGSVGAAWVFRRQDSGQWVQDGAKLVGGNAVGASQQGFSVALNRPGNIALVGGPGDNGGVGAFWSFQRRLVGWRQAGTKIIGADAVGAARQGTSVSLSSNGATALIGGPADNKSAGAAWSFTRWKGVWRQQGPKHVGGLAIGAAEQGRSVSLSGSGNIALVGGPRDNDGIGAAWVYDRFFHGAPQVAGCYTQSVAALTNQYGGMNTAAWAMRYGMANVEPLESAIHAYCGDSEMVQSAENR